jgi:hypothetical protein
MLFAESRRRAERPLRCDTSESIHRPTADDHGRAGVSKRHRYHPRDPHDRGEVCAFAARVFRSEPEIARQLRESHRTCSPSDVSSLRLSLVARDSTSTDPGHTDSGVAFTVVIPAGRLASRETARGRLRCSCRGIRERTATPTPRAREAPWQFDAVCATGVGTRSVRESSPFGWRANHPTPGDALARRRGGVADVAGRAVLAPCALRAARAAAGCELGAGPRLHRFHLHFELGAAGQPCAWSTGQCDPAAAASPT